MKIQNKIQTERHLSFLLDFLDNSSQKYRDAIEFLDDRIIDMAYEAATTIESNVTYRVLDASAVYKEISFLSFCHTLEKVIGEIDSTDRVENMLEDECDVQDPQSRISSLSVSSNPAATGISNGKSNMVGHDDDIMEIMNRLIGGSSKLGTVSLVGMGGIGKSTLATKLYEDESIVYRFYIRAWATVSQDYNKREILVHLLGSMKRLVDGMGEVSDEKLSEFLYKNLKGSRYLIVLDDVWDTKVLDDLKRLFPNDKNGSRIMLTTRLENVANYENSFSPHHMRFLNWDESWNLFCGKVFGKDFCPPELENIGIKIVENCRGLTLAIVVIGGLLSKAIKTPAYWSDVVKNLSSIMISNDEQFSKILSLSYKNMPRHLKGCFLYMAILPEQFINISKLIKLWVAEGLLKPVKSKSLEGAAKEYLLDLVDRNLVLVHQQSSRGKIKSCKIHDLLRDLCTREAESGKLFQATDRYLQGISRCIGQQGLRIRSHRNVLPPTVWHNIVTRVWSRQHRGPRPCVYENKTVRSQSLLQFELGVLEMENGIISNSSSVMSELVNLRYLACACKDVTFLTSMHKLRNLQTIIVENTSSTSVELDIWKMPELRHVQLKHVFLPDPPSEENSFIVLKHLQTLYLVYDLKITPEILKRIPNLKKLRVSYGQWRWNQGYFCLNNLVDLHKLESLRCIFSCLSPSSLKNITFPASLQKLAITGGKFPWKDMRIVGSLPNLQVLNLKNNAFHGREWELNEGEFRQLKFLLLDYIYLVHWRAENTHFPSLQHLVIKSCSLLNEIPSSIGEIPTLVSIKVFHVPVQLQLPQSKYRRNYIAGKIMAFKLKFS